MISIKDLIKTSKINKKNIKFYKNKEYFYRFFKKNRKNHFKVFDMIYLLWKYNGELNRIELIEKHKELTQLDEISSFRALEFLLENYIVIEVGDKIILPREVYIFFTHFYQKEVGILTKKEETTFCLETEEIEKAKKFYGLTKHPSNEEEVKFLFVHMMKKLGILALERIEIYFPDATGIVKLNNNQFKRIYIEFEYNSSSFIAHNHIEDMRSLKIDPHEMWIVCWNHDGKLPKDIKVIELKKMVI